jgi:hypothetical protein
LKNWKGAKFTKTVGFNQIIIKSIAAGAIEYPVLWYIHQKNVL